MYGHWKIVLKAATAVALVSSAAMLTTTEASAQFGFEGLIRGAMTRGCCGGGFSRHHGRVHESRHHRRSKSDEADDEDSSKGKGEKSADKDNKGDIKSASEVKPASASGDVKAAASPGGTSPPAQAANTNPPKQPVADVPNLTPER